MLSDYIDNSSIILMVVAYKQKIRKFPLFHPYYYPYTFIHDLISEL
jgi:hypothetical protein